MTCTATLRRSSTDVESRLVSFHRPAMASIPGKVTAMSCCHALGSLLIAPPTRGSSTESGTTIGTR